MAKFKNHAFLYFRYGPNEYNIVLKEVNDIREQDGLVEYCFIMYVFDSMSYKRVGIPEKKCYASRRELLRRY